MTRKTAEWLDKARQDLKAARALIEKGDDDYLGIVGFLSQQCVEKGLKGFLASEGVAFPLTHDLSMLLTLCSRIDSAFLEFAPDAARLGPFAVEVRYPSDLPRGPTQAEAASFVDLADRVSTFVVARIEKG